MAGMLSLFCLVDGQSLSSAFPLLVPSTETVGGLKKLIKADQSPDFDNIVANKLTLWSVSIPNDKKGSAIAIGSLDGKTEFDDPRALLSELFPKSPDRTIYIIVCRPPPVHLPVSNPTLKSVSFDHIEQELVDILKGVSYSQTTSIIDPKVVEASQRKKLGRFYKRPLPFYETATNISLVMLGLELDKQAKTSEGETLCSIVEGDIGKLSRSVIAMVAPSGSGKTATVIDLATEHFVVYCVCRSTRPTISPEFEDLNFAQLAIDVEEMHANIIRTQRVGHDLLDIESEANRLARQRVEHEFLARLLFLQLLLNKNPDLEPQQFFREQTTATGTSTICELVNGLRKYDSPAIQYMLDFVQTKLHAHLKPRHRGLAIALDEAQVAASSILPGKFISPPALAAYWNTRNSPSVLFDAKNEIQRHLRCGFLTPLSATLSRMQATLVILGTALSLQDADHVYTAIGKETNFTRITDFPLLDEDDVNNMLSDLVDLSECEIPPAKRLKLSGRARFSLGIINHLVATGSVQGSKQTTLDDATDHAIEHVMSGLQSGVRAFLRNDQAGGTTQLLARMVLAYQLHGGKISFPSKDQPDFVDKALCRLQQHPDGVHLIMVEPLVVEAVKKELEHWGKDAALIAYMDQLHEILTNLGVTSAAKGNALEPLVRRSLQRFNGYLLEDLPFLRGVSLPTWCKDLRIQIDEINTADGFGYTAGGCLADLEFLKECLPNKMLIAESGTRPDGAWFFSNTRYAGSLAIKFYSDNMKRTMHESNETSSDIRSCFLGKDAIKENESLAAIRYAFKKSDIPANLRGILRIHLEFPGVQGGNTKTYIKRDPAKEIEDVMVYIHLSDLDDFFYEGISENLEDMVKLKALIRFVCG